MTANLAKKRSQDFWKEVKNMEKLNRACPLVLMVQIDLLIYVMLYNCISFKVEEMDTINHEIGNQIFNYCCYN